MTLTVAYVQYAFSKPEDRGCTELQWSLGEVYILQKNKLTLTRLCSR